MLSLSRPSGKYDAHADFMGIGVSFLEKSLFATVWLKG